MTICAKHYCNKTYIYYINLYFLNNTARYKRISFSILHITKSQFLLSRCKTNIFNAVFIKVIFNFNTLMYFSNEKSYLDIYWRSRHGCIQRFTTNKFAQVCEIKTGKLGTYFSFKIKMCEKIFHVNIAY